MPPQGNARAPTKNTPRKGEHTLFARAIRSRPLVGVFLDALPSQCGAKKKKPARVDFLRRRRGRRTTEYSEHVEDFLWKRVLLLLLDVKN